MYHYDLNPEACSWLPSCFRVPSSTDTFAIRIRRCLSRQCQTTTRSFTRFTGRWLTIRRICSWLFQFRRVCPWLSRLRLTTEWSKLNENRPKPMETTFHDLTLLVFYI
ncbi:hypothetical protein GCK32_021438 [Trichostrongylus colubriformis]|uniref:Uncharacterized protein n=1 Tax=Trichostrongylus colubriformis TaxID=6319 RepID=A0AAN8GCC2_TRICO